MTKMDKVLKKIDNIVKNMSISEIDMRILLDEYEKIINEIASETIYEKEKVNINNRMEQFDIFDLHINSTSNNKTKEVLAA